MHFLRDAIVLLFNAVNPFFSIFFVLGFYFFYFVKEFSLSFFVVWLNLLQYNATVLRFGQLGKFWLKLQDGCAKWPLVFFEFSHLLLENLLILAFFKWFFELAFKIFYLHFHDFDLYIFLIKTGTILILLVFIIPGLNLVPLTLRLRYKIFLSFRFTIFSVLMGKLLKGLPIDLVVVGAVLSFKRLLLDLVVVWSVPHWRVTVRNVVYSFLRIEHLFCIIVIQCAVRLESSGHVLLKRA